MTSILERVTFALDDAKANGYVSEPIDASNIREWASDLIECDPELENENINMVHAAIVEYVENCNDNEYIQMFEALELATNILSSAMNAGVMYTVPDGERPPVSYAVSPFYLGEGIMPKLRNALNIAKKLAKK